MTLVILAGDFGARLILPGAVRAGRGANALLGDEGRHHASLRSEALQSASDRDDYGKSKIGSDMERSDADRRTER